MKHRFWSALAALAQLGGAAACGRDPAFVEREARQAAHGADAVSGDGAASGEAPGDNATGDGAKSGEAPADGAAATPASGADSQRPAGGSASGATPAPVPPEVFGPTAPGGKSCRERRLLLYSLQPAGSAAFYENLSSELVAPLTADGYLAAFANRATVPVLTDEYLRAFDLVVFVSGCGGDTGVPDATELGAIARFYQQRGSVAVITDDDVGDGTAPGSCQPRANAIARNLGVEFSGVQDNTAHGCALLQTADPLLAGLRLGRYTSADVRLLGAGAWGGTPVLLGTLANGRPAEVYVAPEPGHGAALLSTDFGSLSCDGKQYLERLVERLGCAN